MARVTEVERDRGEGHDVRLESTLAEPEKLEKVCGLSCRGCRFKSWLWLCDLGQVIDPL